MAGYFVRSAQNCEPDNEGGNNCAMNPRHANGLGGV